MLFALILMSAGLKAEGLGDQITASLIDHVAAHSQYTAKGENRLALLADIVEIGKLNGKAIGQLRFGFTGIANAAGGVDRGAGYVADAYINAAPFVRKYVKLAPEWEFLNSVEVGPSVGYDFRSHHTVYSLSVGLAFNLKPI